MTSTSALALSSRRPSTSAPQAGGTPKPVGASPSTPRAASTTATNGISVGTTRPGSTVPRPSSTLPSKPMTHPGQGQMPVKQQQQIDAPPTIMRAGTPMNIDQIQQRGKKREREDSNVGMNGVANGIAPHSGVLPAGLAVPPAQAPMANGYVNGNGIVPSKMVVNARAGTAGVRPRPIKKQKMVSYPSFVPHYSFAALGVLLESFTAVNCCADVTQLLLYLGCARAGERCCSSCATADTTRRLTFFLSLPCRRRRGR